MDSKTMIFVTVILGITALIIFIPKGTTPTIPGTVTEWQKSYAEQVESAGLSKFTENTNYYDYTDKTITAVAEQIAGESNNADDATKKAAEYIYNHISYVYGEADNSCFDGTAPTILASGEGQCDTQSITLISILRRMGIPATPAGGCIVYNQKCDAYAIFITRPQNSFVIDLNKTQWSRGLDFRNLLQSTIIPGIGRYGGLHAWVMAWVNGEWKAVEATTGTYANENCYQYHVELFPKDQNKDDICVSKNFAYAQACKQDDLVALDKQGLGLVTKVNPQ